MRRDGLLVAGRRVHCPFCGLSRLVSVTEHGGEIGPNREEGMECGQGAFVARIEYVGLVRRWVGRKTA